MQNFNYEREIKKLNKLGDFTYYGYDAIIAV